MSTPLIAAPDLTQRPPRSPRVRLGGFVILPRLLDKARAKAAGTVGEYLYNRGLDQRFLSFVQADADALFAEIASGKGDGEILEWILANAGSKPNPWDIARWSAYQESRTFDTVQAKERVLEQLKRINEKRSDILTAFDLLDLDDYVSFGGQA